MKRIIILIVFLTSGILAQSQIIGLQKTFTLPDESTGNFLTIDTYDPPAIYGDSTLFKVDYKLYKTKTSFQNGKQKMNYRYEVQFYIKNSDVPVTGFTDFLYNNSITKDSTLFDAIKIY